MMDKIKVKDKEYDLEDYDAALILTLQELIRTIKDIQWHLH